MFVQVKKLEKQAWFVWLTKYWFLFPIAGFLLLEGGVFLYFGERSYIAVSGAVSDAEKYGFFLEAWRGYAVSWRNQQR